MAPRDANSRAALVVARAHRADAQTGARSDRHDVTAGCHDIGSREDITTRGNVARDGVDARYVRRGVLRRQRVHGPAVRDRVGARVGCTAGGRQPNPCSRADAVRRPRRDPRKATAGRTAPSARTHGRAARATRGLTRRGPGDTDAPGNRATEERTRECDRHAPREGRPAFATSCVIGSFALGHVPTSSAS